MMHYCDNCRKLRGFPKSTMTEKPFQCDFCDRYIGRCYQGLYASLVGLDRNTEVFSTAKDSISVCQDLSIPANLPITKIKPKEKKHYVNDKMIIVHNNLMCLDGSINICIINRHTGEQIEVQM